MDMWGSSLLELNSEIVAEIRKESVKTFETIHLSYKGNHFLNSSLYILPVEVVSHSEAIKAIILRLHVSYQLSDSTMKMVGYHVKVI